MWHTRKKMIRNYYYFAVGLLFILFAVTHTINGIDTVLPILFGSNIEINSKIVFQYIWHIIGIENFIFGCSLIFASVYKEFSKFKFIAWFLITILISRWVIISYFTMSNNVKIQQIIPDTIAILLIVILLFLGARTKKG